MSDAELAFSPLLIGIAIVTTIARIRRIGVALQLSVPF